MIHFDRSQRSVVAVCSRCGWRDLSLTYLAALQAGAGHEQAHSTADAAKMRERHARVVASQRGRPTP